MQGYLCLSGMDLYLRLNHSSLETTLDWLFCVVFCLVTPSFSLYNDYIYNTCSLLLYRDSPSSTYVCIQQLQLLCSCVSAQRCLCLKALVSSKQYSTTVQPYPFSCYERPYLKHGKQVHCSNLLVPESHWLGKLCKNLVSFACLCCRGQLIMDF